MIYLGFEGVLAGSLCCLPADRPPSAIRASTATIRPPAQISGFTSIFGYPVHLVAGQFGQPTHDLGKSRHIHSLPAAEALQERRAP